MQLPLATNPIRINLSTKDLPAHIEPEAKKPDAGTPKNGISEADEYWLTETSQRKQQKTPAKKQIRPSSKT